jgi:hypothetical protein
VQQDAIKNTLKIREHIIVPAPHNTKTFCVKKSTTPFITAKFGVRAMGRAIHFHN